MKKNKNGVIITSVVLSTVIAVTSIGYSLNKQETNNITATISTTTQAVQIDSNSNNNILEEETVSTQVIEEVTRKEVLETYSYEELISQLEQNYEKFDKQTQTYLRTLVEIVYKNGTDLDRILNQISDFEVSNFIMKNIIEPLDKIKNIEIVSYDNYDRLSELDYRTCYDEEKQEIRICNETENLNYQRLLEELMHTNQTDILSDVKTDKEFDYADYCIFAEGEANVLSWPLTYGAICNDSVCVMYSDDTYSDENIIYGTGYSYSAATKYYVYLVTLLGHDTMQKVRQSHDPSIITNALQEQYGIDGEEFYSKMKDVVVDLMSNIDNKRTHMLAPIENTFFECLEKKLATIDNREDLVEFFDLYRYINIQYGFVHNEFDENSNTIDCTNKKIDKSIEDKIFEKLEEYSILDQFVNDSISKRKVFDALINPTRDEEKPIYPVSLANVNVSYDENSNSLILQYNDKSIVTKINNRESAVVKGQVGEQGFKLFELSEEKIL